MSDIYLGTVGAVEPTDPWKRGFDCATRLMAQRVAEQLLGRHVMTRPDRTAPLGVVTLVAAEETLREREIIAEGLAMFKAAARQNPDLWHRHPCTSAALVEAGR